jgi:ribosomal protein S18 acetylase RimI-like enzyme
MVAELVIRAATLEDESAWVRLNRAFMQEVADSDPAWGTLEVPSPEALGRTFREALATPEGIRIFLVLGEEVQGYANTWTVYSVWSGGKALVIDDLYVTAGHRGRGAGETLMRHLEAYAREQGCRRMQLHADPANLRAHGLYRKLGMQGEGMLFFRKLV